MFLTATATDFDNTTMVRSLRQRRRAIFSASWLRAPGPTGVRLRPCPPMPNAWISNVRLRVSPMAKKNIPAPLSGAVRIAAHLCGVICLLGACWSVSVLTDPIARNSSPGLGVILQLTMQIVVAIVVFVLPSNVDQQRTKLLAERD